MLIIENEYSIQSVSWITSHTGPTWICYTAATSMSFLPRILNIFMDPDDIEITETFRTQPELIHLKNEFLIPCNNKGRVKKNKNKKVGNFHGK